MRILRKVLYVALFPVGAFLLFLLYASIGDYKPKEVTHIAVTGEAAVLSDSAELNILNWNIGYAGLDASMDFFYDGGDMIRPSKEGVELNLEGILETLAPYSDYDFVLLQEVDRDSKRSYHRNQTKSIGESFPGHTSCFGINYKVFFVPIPLSEPMGKVESGLLSLTKQVPTKVDRHNFPGNYSWPMSLFMLDRCFLVKRHPVSNGKELVVINTHNSAYDDGSLRAKQMGFMRDFLLSEYQKGNYVIVGGDWNQTPFGMEPRLPSHQYDTINLTFIEKDYPETGWTWAFDTTLPTNRRVAVPYNRETSLTTVIDCYLLSPNIELEEVKTIDTDFKFSDHQPVQLKARLKPT